MTTILVDSNNALTAALSNAHAGDTIALAAGTYSKVQIKNFNANGAITITSQDATHEAVLTGLEVGGSTGLNFNNLEFSFPMGDGSASPHGIMVRNSQDVHFLNDDIHGVLSADPTNQVTGIGIANSSNVSVQNSDLHDLHTGVTAGSDNNVTITGNYIHNIRVDGLEAMADNTITVSGNTFTDFHHLGQSGVIDPTTGKQGDHSDAIQFWTTGQTVGSNNVTISNNVISQGNGRDMQGIFVQDAHGNLPYTNLQVTGNLIVGGNWNGIMVDDAKGGLIADNIVQGLNTENQSPWIKVQNSTGTTLSNNAAKTIGLGTNDTGLNVTGSKFAPVVSDGGSSEIASWLHSHSGSSIGLLGLHMGDLTASLGGPILHTS